MLRSVVVPLDGSDFAGRALPTASSIARCAHVPMRIIGVARAHDQLSRVYDHVHAAVRSVTNGSAPDVDIVIDPDPVAVMLHVGDEPGALLCFASHDRPHVPARLMHSVGSELMARATQPYVVVGERVTSDAPARDVVVAVDGVGDQQPLLEAAASWAPRLQTALRIVTVYEPVLADLRRPDHYTRMHGPAGDPDRYLEGVRGEVARYGVTNVSTEAIPDPISPAQGLEAHLQTRPATLLVVGGTRNKHPIGGTVRRLVSTAGAPLLVVNALA
jgi:hypothetical protein